MACRSPYLGIARLQRALVGRVHVERLTEGAWMVTEFCRSSWRLLRKAIQQVRS